MRRVCRACAVMFAVATFVLLATAMRAGESSSHAVPVAQLAAKLEEASDARLDVELKSGKSFIRSKLLKVTAGKEGAPPKTLKIQDPESGKPVTIAFSSVRSIALDRETIYTAASSGGKSGKAAMVERELKAAAAEREKWVARASEHGVQPWPELTTEDHKAADKAIDEQIEKIQKTFPGMELYETHEFKFLSNMPRQQVIPYATSLDQMYDLMCGMYRIRKGTSVWKGKCLVVAFLEQPSFMQYEMQFFNNPNSLGAQGICHQNSAGDVVISCYRGNSPQYFGQVLVHETSHGFIHRYRTAERLPSWGNEGMADWIAAALVNYAGGVQSKQKIAIKSMQQTRSMQGLFQGVQLSSVSYGTASLLTDFLIRTDKGKYADWVNGMKEGKTWEESLKDSYQVTPDQLVSAFGQSIGVPNLRP